MAVGMAGKHPCVRVGSDPSLEGAARRARTADDGSVTTVSCHPSGREPQPEAQAEAADGRHGEGCLPWPVCAAQSGPAVKRDAVRGLARVDAMVGTAERRLPASAGGGASVQSVH